MKFKKYVLDLSISIFIYLFTIILVCSLLNVLKIPKYINIIIFMVLLLCGFIIVVINYFRKYNFYNILINNLDKLDKKYLILETMPEAKTYEESVMADVMYEINKSMIENIRSSQNNINEFKEFVEMWIHEVKIPIASMVLKCHNHRDKYNSEYGSLIRKLDNSVDQVLYYVRAEDTEKDFFINRVDLKEVIREVGIKNKEDLLLNNISFLVDLDIVCVYTDKKWLEFIINQIINNSIKYKKDNDSQIKISSYLDNGRICLSIYDNGIGISEGDLKRVFDKSFTGKNGRCNVKSTGMGLYIVKNLCDKLGHNIKIFSKEKEYTKVVIEFGNNDMYKF